jgi:hypothetical protein
MKWIPTTYGAVSERFIIRIERDDNGSLLFLTDGSKARTPLLFDVVDGELQMIEPDDDSGSDVPF